MVSISPTVEGVGYLGVLSNGTPPKTSVNGKNTPEYTCWNGMLKRCYSKTWQSTHPTYQGSKVWERWHCFANFLEDMPKIEGYELWRERGGKGVVLDKDIKGNNSKIYSLDTCCFTTKTENARERLVRCGNPQKGQTVIAIDLTTNEIVEYPSVREASRVLGRSHSAISACCRGLRNHAYGYKWQYKNKRNSTKTKHEE